MLAALRCVIHRDLLLAVRRSSDLLTVLLFFVIVVSLFPLGIGPEPALLRTIAPGVIGVVGAALTLGLRGGGALLSLLVLPLYVPVLIIGAGAAEAAASGLGGHAQLLLLGAFLVFAWAFAPWATAVALRISVE